MFIYVHIFNHLNNTHDIHDTPKTLCFNTIKQQNLVEAFNVSILTDLNIVSKSRLINYLCPKPVHSSADPSVVWETLTWSDSSDSWTTVKQVFVANITDILDSNRTDASIKLMDWDATVVAQHLAADVFADGCGAIQLQEHVGLQKVLCAFNLTLCD